jgi:transcription antitermination factor NusG
MVSDQLRGKGYDEFLPMCWSRRLWSDRVKVIQMPLFSGYLFCRFDPDDRFSILTTPGVCTIVGRGRTPLPVDATQVENIRLAVRSGQGLEPWPRLEVGNKVRIEVGPLCGVEGTLLRHKGTSHLILGVTLMQRAVAVEVNETWVVPSPNVYAAPKSAHQSAQPQLVS